MICLNQYKLLGFLSMLLAVDAWFLDAFNGDEEQPLDYFDDPELVFEPELVFDDVIVENVVNVLPSPQAHHGPHPHPHPEPHPHQEPQVNYQEPQVNYQEPEDHYPEPQVQYHEPAVQYPSPAVHYPEPAVHYPEPQVHYQEPVVHYQEPLPVAQHGYHPAPVYTAPQVDVYKYEPLKVEQVWKEAVLERAFNEIYAVPLITSDTWYSTVTDTKYFTAVGYQRATVTVTPPAIYKTLTKIMSTVSMVEAAGIRTQKLWISETLIMGTTTTYTSTTWRTSTTRNYQPVTQEEQITQTVWEQFTVTSTGLATVTEWETRPYELLQVHRVRVPVVSIITATTRLPHHKTMTKWITRTLTSTIACVKSHYPQPQQGYAAPQPVYAPQPQQGYAAPQPVYPHH